METSMYYVITYREGPVSYFFFLFSALKISKKGKGIENVITIRIIH